jgi:hypothetical protein
VALMYFGTACGAYIQVKPTITPPAIKSQPDPGDVLQQLMNGYRAFEVEGRTVFAQQTGNCGETHDQLLRSLCRLPGVMSVNVISQNTFIVWKMQEEDWAGLAARITETVQTYLKGLRIV